MKSGIIDKNGIEIKEGDTICLPYITPMGELTEEVDKEREVVFRFGCFGYWNETYFVPLIDWMTKETGDYVPNQGNKIVYTDNYLCWVK